MEARLNGVADLAGVRAKLRRADEHRRVYDELFESYLETHPYSILFEFDPESGWHVFRWVVVNEPPLEELSLIFCDILGNLRSALDYLVWQLVLHGGRKPGRQTGFPIVKRERDWDVQGASALKGVGPEWAELIEAMQPFQRPERPELHPLAILEHVNNLTKHRFLPAAVLTVENFGYLINIADVPEGERFESQDHLDRPVENGGEVARFRTESRLPVAVQIADNPRFRLSFKDGVELDWRPGDLVEWVTEAAAQFEPAFY
jgi:hypothetical protein